MDTLIWFLVIFGIFNTLTGSSKKKQQSQRRQQPPLTPPVYRMPEEASHRRTMMPPLENHPYSPVKPTVSSKPVSEVQPKPVVKSRPKSNQQKMSSGTSLEGQSLEGQSMEGLPLDYNIGDTRIDNSSAAAAEPKSIFTRDDMIKGIIMSEILDKPKALRR